MVRVYVDMTADLFHSGHVNFLRSARELGSYLIVGLLSDELASSYKRKPILSLKERAEIVASCRYVDEVIEGCPLVPDHDWIQKQAIDIIAHGDDFDIGKQRLYYKDAMDLGIFRTISYTSGISTSEIIQRIKQDTDAA